MGYQATGNEQYYQATGNEQYYQINSITSFETETLAYIGGLDMDLSSSLESLLNTLVLDLKNGLGVTSLSDAFDIIYIVKNESEEVQLRNLAQRDFDGTLYNTSGFEPYKGITGDGSTLYIGTNFIPSTDAVAYKLNDGSVHIYSETLPEEDKYIFHAPQTSTGGVLNLTPNRVGGNWIARHNTTTLGQKAAEMSLLSAGMISLNRAAAANYFVYNEKAKIGTFDIASVGLPDNELKILNNVQYFATNTVEFFALGKAFTEVEIDIITDAYASYSASVDAIIADETSSPGDLETQSVSLPDMFNADVDYPQSGYGTAMTWIFDAIAAKGCDLFFIAGDLSNGRWGDKTAHDITTQTNIYWAAYKARLDALSFDCYVGMGDHEYGDFAEDMTSAYSSMDDIPEWRSQFRSIFQMPLGAPSPFNRLSYTVVENDAVFIMTCPFEDLGGATMVASVSGSQLDWVESELVKYSDKKFKIVFGHMPAMTPSGGTGSSIVLADGVNSDFWQLLVKHGVDLYDCGEWHNYLDLKENGGILQVTHGSHFGHDYTHSFLQCSVYENKMDIEIFSYDITLTGAEIREDVYEGLSITNPGSSPVSAGKITLWDTSIGKYRNGRTGIFEI